MAQSANGVAPARIGSGMFMIWGGVVLLALGSFAAMAAAGGGEGAGGFAILALSLGGALISIGFWVNLAHKIELRLIDIQRATMGDAGPQADDRQAGADGFLG